jgi:hypothetical protein
MQSAKQDVQKMLASIPEDASYEEIQYHVYVRQKIRSSLHQINLKRTLSQKEIERRMARWLRP